MNIYPSLFSNAYSGKKCGIFENDNCSGYPVILSEVEISITFFC